MKRRVGEKIRALVSGGVEPLRQQLSDQLRSVSSDLAVLREQLQGEMRSVSSDLVVLREQLQGEADRVDELVSQIAGLARGHAYAEEKLERLLLLAAAQRDEIPWHRRELAAVRDTPAYSALWQEREPLISVRIPTWNQADLLVDRALASVLRQTYQNFEVVVVGDGCTDDTEARLRRLGDERIRFQNLPFRGPYPEDPKRLWMMAGAGAANVGTRMARGSWLAPLDDDDEFTDDHLEVLLGAALKGHFELVYGKLESDWTRVEETRPSLAASMPRVIGSYPPQIGQVSLQASMFTRLLAFCEHDMRSWLLDEPGDWTFFRRLMEVGTQIGFVDRVVARIWPSGRQFDDAGDG